MRKRENLPGHDSTIVIMTVRSRAAAACMQVMLHAPREEATLRRARRDYFGEVRNNICDLAKIVRGRTALGCRGGEGVSRSQQASYGDPARADKSLLSSTYS